MSNLEPRIEAIRKEYGLDASDFWQIPQNKQWVCKHSALEIVAAKAQVEFESPVVIEADTANGIAVLSVLGMMYKSVPSEDGGKGHRQEMRREWATGEASPKNCKNAYPWAMAEKRAKDRVILKLVGIHGLVYADSEADAFEAPKEPAQQQGPTHPKPKGKTVAERKAIWASLMEEVKLEGAKGYEKIDAYMLNRETQKLIADLGDYQADFIKEVRQIRGMTKAAQEASGEPVGKIMERTLPSFDHLAPNDLDPIEELIGTNNG